MSTAPAAQASVFTFTARLNARLQPERAQRVELVAGEHHDALRIRPHLGFTRRMADPAVRWSGVDGCGLGCTRFVWPALIA